MTRQYLSSLAVVACLIVLVSVWAMYGQGGDITSFERILDFSSAVVERLFNQSSTLPSAYLIFGSLAVLVLLSTLSAWLQVQLPDGFLKRYDLLLFVPSFVPVYVYGISLENAVTEGTLFGFPIFIVVVALGNGLWWWWHRQFVENLRTLFADKAAAGVANMGLSVEQFYVLPEFVRGVWRKLPEMVLWVLVNSLFLEAAVPESSGILFDLVRSLSDGGQSIDWAGVVTTVTFIGLVWLLIRWCSEFILSRPLKYRGWGLIQSDVLIPTSRNTKNYTVIVSTLVVAIPWLLLVVIFSVAVNDATPYWEFLGLMMSVSLVVYGWIIGQSLYEKYWLNKSTHQVEGCPTVTYFLVPLIAVAIALIGLQALSKATWELHSLTVYSNVQDDQVFINGKYEGESPLIRRLPSGQYDIRVERDSYESIEQTIELDGVHAFRVELLKSSAGLDDMFSEDATRPIPKNLTDQTTFSENIRNVSQLFFMFILFLIPSVVIFSVGLLSIGGYFFSAHYKWKGNNWRWKLYQLLNQSLEALSRIPPYLLLVITIFWLGFQTFDSCTKQFAWTVALLLVLLPTQLLRVSSWIDEASNARFLTARRSLGVSALSTFRYLLRSRWMKGLIAIVAFSVGLGLLMDISMIWLLGERGSFTCNGNHWLNFFGPEKSIQSWQVFIMWLAYPLLMLGLIRKTSNL